MIFYQLCASISRDLVLRRRLDLYTPCQWFLRGTPRKSSDAPKIPRALPEEKPASIGDDGTSVEAVVNTESVKDLYEAKMEKYEEELLDCDDKYSRACATIRLSCKDGPRVYIKGVESRYGRS